MSNKKSNIVEYAKSVTHYGGNGQQIAKQKIVFKISKFGGMLIAVVTLVSLFSFIQPHIAIAAIEFAGEILGADWELRKTTPLK